MAAPRESTSTPDTAFAPTLDGAVPSVPNHPPPAARLIVAGEAMADPSRIGRYLILRRLGQGGMGIVYLAYDPDLDRRVAIKLVRREQCLEPVGRSRIKQEAQTMAKVAHPNIVHVYEVGDSDGQLYIAMEYVAGIPLSSWQAQRDTGVAAIQQTLKVYVQAAAGLSAAHKAGLIHRDFKPDNVLVDSEGRARVFDFGIARALDGLQGAVEVHQHSAANPGGSEERLTQAGAILGTPGYMSPEQVRGGDTDPRTDQFSFCAALYEALYRQLPYAGDNFEEFARELLAGRLRPPPSKEVPLAVERALTRGLSIDPTARYPSMQELIAAIEAGLDPDSESATTRRAARWTGGLVVSWMLITGLTAARGPINKSEDLMLGPTTASIATIGFVVSFLVFGKRLMRRDTTRRLVYQSLVQLGYFDAVRLAGYWLQLPVSRYVPIELLGIGALYVMAAPQLSWRYLRLAAICVGGSLLIIRWPQLRLLAGTVIYPLAAFGSVYYTLIAPPQR